MNVQRANETTTRTVSLLPSQRGEKQDNTRLRHRLLKQVCLTLLVCWVMLLIFQSTMGNVDMFA